MKVSAKELRELSSTLNILYVEDEEILREAMQNTLSKLFMSVYTAKNGQEAFELFKKEDIDLVMTDINMPIMGGIELIETIHRYTDKDPKIIVLSAHNESKLLSKLINMGVNNFLNKPVDKELMIHLFYNTCQAIVNQKLLSQYQVRLEEELIVIERKNKILEQKLKQFAHQANKNEVYENKKSQEEIQKVRASDDNYFETLLADDKDELRDLSYDLDNYIAMLFTGEGLNTDYLEKLSSAYKKFASILNSYPEFFDIALALVEFAESILHLEEKFMKNLNQTGIYFESLQMTLENFRQNVWEREAQNPRFYNASLRIDIQGIIDFLEEKEIQENEIEFF
jgi:YesN/AraC family two-component response regulator